MGNSVTGADGRILPPLSVHTRGVVWGVVCGVVWGGGLRVDQLFFLSFYEYCVNSFALTSFVVFVDGTSTHAATVQRKVVHWDDCRCC